MVGVAVAVWVVVAVAVVVWVAVWVAVAMTTPTMTLLDLERELVKCGASLSMQRIRGGWSILLFNSDVTVLARDEELETAIAQALAMFDERVAQSFAKGEA